MKLYTSITLLFCLMVGILQAQPKSLPDSIRVEFPDYQSIITFELRKYEDNKEVIRNFPSQLEDMLHHINSSLTESARNKPQQIDMVYVDSKNGEEKYTLLAKEFQDEVTKVTVSQQAIVELLPPGWEVHIKMKEAEIRIYAPSMERLTELSHVNLESVITHLNNKPETKQQMRFGLISRIIFKDGNVEEDQTTHRIPNDMLGLHAGAGIGLIRDKFYPEFNFTTSFYFANRYKENHQRISALYELKLFTGRTTEGNYLSWPASFLSLSYAMNFSKDRTRWTGLGAGFLVHNRSDLFTGKTLKLFIESDIGSPKLNIVPEFYLTNDYKQAMFGLKLNYKF